MNIQFGDVLNLNSFLMIVILIWIVYKIKVVQFRINNLYFMIDLLNLHDYIYPILFTFFCGAVIYYGCICQSRIIMKLYKNKVIAQKMNKCVFQNNKQHFNSNSTNYILCQIYCISVTIYALFYLLFCGLLLQMYHGCICKSKVK